MKSQIKYGRFRLSFYWSYLGVEKGYYEIIEIFEWPEGSKPKLIVSFRTIATPADLDHLDQLLKKFSELWPCCFLAKEWPKTEGEKYVTLNSKGEWVSQNRPS